MDKSKLIAHRGDNTHFPENTHHALEAALKAGAKGIEFDVQMNADHSLLVFHDDNLKRMTGTLSTSLFELSDAELSTLSIHEPEQFGEQHKPTPISHLTDILDLLKTYPDAHAYVEIKEESLKHWGLAHVMDKLLATLKGFEQQATVISFSAKALAYTQQHSKLTIGYVFESYDRETRQTAEALSPQFLVCPHRIIPDAGLWQGPWQWMLYNANTSELASTLTARNDIALVETDDIQTLLNSGLAGD